MSVVIAQVIGRVGSVALTTDVIIKVQGVNRYEIEADIPETDIAKLAVGMEAEITLDAYGDDVTFAGSLKSIDTAETIIQDVVYYKTRFLLEESELQVRAGMTANVDVPTATREQAILVPQRAIRQSNETKFVRVLVEGQEVNKTVELGLYGDGGSVEIISGLEEGDEVIIASRERR